MDAMESATIKTDFMADQPISENGFTSVKSQTIEMVCLPNNMEGLSSFAYQGTRAQLYMANLSQANARYVATASAYAVPPLPPLVRAFPSSRIPAFRASATTRLRASITSSLKVVRVTSWRGVKRSACLVIPYSWTLKPNACSGSSVSGIQLGFAFCATDTCSSVGAT